MLLALGASVRAANPVKPVPLILDTDMGNDIDDALALAMVHAFENRGQARLLAVTVTKDNRYAAPFVDLVNNFYGRANIPIGVVRGGKTPDDAPYIKEPSEARTPSQGYRFPHSLKDGGDAPEAVSVLERVLGGQPDGSVTVVQIGFSTNLARLLNKPGGIELVARKVNLLVLMAGDFAGGKPEYNVYTDAEAARVLFEKWPRPMVFSGYEIGNEITFPYAAFSTGFAHPAANPIVAAAQSFFKKPEDRPAWDPTAVLYAVQPNAGLFSLSPPGRVTLGPKNTTVFTADPQGRCRYLILNQAKAAEARRVLVDLVTEPPRVPSRR
jgi:inosine-uridine nucleoside N-ribohydrolase